MKPLSFQIKITVESPFIEVSKKKKNRVVREIGGKITMFDCAKGNNFCFELSGGSNECSRNRDPAVVILKHRILYDLDRQLGKIRHSQKKQ